MEFEIYSKGLCHASVCTSLSVRKATERLNEEYPTGIPSQWQPSKVTHFAGDTHTNPCDCPDYKGNRHYLFVC